MAITGQEALEHVVGDVENGVLSLATNGSFTYQPTAGFEGTDSFTYQNQGGALTSNLATVTITVTGTRGEAWRSFVQVVKG